MSIDFNALTWMVLDPADMDQVRDIGRKYYPDLPEDVENFLPWLKYWPTMNLKLVHPSNPRKLYGYGLSHPYYLGMIPALNSKMEDWPVRPYSFGYNAIHMHDCCIVEEARGFCSSFGYIGHMEEKASALEPFVQLVAVHGSHKIWTRLGYEIVSDLSEASLERLATYGKDAVFMVKIVGPVS